MHQANILQTGCVIVLLVLICVFMFFGGFFRVFLLGFFLGKIMLGWNGIKDKLPTVSSSVTPCR